MVIHILLCILIYFYGLPTGMCLSQLTVYTYGFTHVNFLSFFSNTCCSCYCVSITRFLSYGLNMRIRGCLTRKKTIVILSIYIVCFVRVYNRRLYLAVSNFEWDALYQDCVWQFSDSYIITRWCNINELHCVEPYFSILVVRQRRSMLYFYDTYVCIKYLYNYSSQSWRIVKCIYSEYVFTPYASMCVQI